jgi:DNA-binding winged helix-turn-helix (wHTH) protein
MIYVFGEFELDERCFELRRKGEPVPVEPRVLRALAYLIRHRDRAVGRDELMDELWPNEAVTPSSLTNSIWALRRALGENGTGERILKTLYRKGYRFMAQVDEVPAEDMIFVDRERELALVADLMERSRRGLTVLVLISGEAGIGKTRLLREIRARGEGDGFGVAWANCCEGGSPYGPFVALVEAIAFGGPAGPESISGGRRNRSTRRKPSSSNDRANVRPPAQPGTGLVATDTVALLAGAARLRPLLLVLEDLHWADRSVFVLLRRILRAIPRERLLILASYREDEISTKHAGAQLLPQLYHHPLCRRIHLPGFGTDAVRRMLVALIHDEPSASLVERIRDETDGNPLFIRELARDLNEQGALRNYSHDWWASLNPAKMTVPLSVRFVMERRLSRISQNALQVLTAGAIIGRSFRFDLVQAVSGIEPDDLMEALGEAEQTGLVRCLRESRAIFYRFSHGLIWRGLWHRTPLSRQQQLQARMAEAVKSTCRGDQLAQDAELARVWSEARSSADWHEIASQLARAGDEAWTSGDSVQAATFYRQALNLTIEMPPRGPLREAPTVQDRCEVMEVVAEPAPVYTQAVRSNFLTVDDSVRKSPIGKRPPQRRDTA